MGYVYTDNDIVKDIEHYMCENGEQLVDKITKIVEKFEKYKTKRTEEDFKMEFAPILNQIAKELNVDFEPQYEKYVKSGRMDCFFNCVNLEYKVPGAIEEQNHYSGRQSSNNKYIEEVHRQIEGYASREKIEKNRILGIIFDGKYLIYTYYLTTDWHTTAPRKLNEMTLEEFFVKLFSYEINGRALCVSNLVEDFGVDSEVSKQMVSCLYNKLISNCNEKVDLIFEQWKALFSEVSGYSSDTVKLDIDEIVGVYHIEKSTLKIDYLIYSIQTYYALFIKLLVTVMLNKKKIKLNINTEENFNSIEGAYHELMQIESGYLFETLGILNFIEEDFFGWYLECWDDDLYAKAKVLISKVYKYNFTETEKLTDIGSQDLLRKLYNYLMPKSLRHSLGEYYSPNWLAEQTYERAGIDGAINKSVLDPTCGSGTFVVIAINKIIERYKDKITKEELLSNILSNVHGFDLNPLAVITARANYLLALGDLLDNTTLKIEIPIYHCDAMLTILEHDVENHVVKKISTRAGVFEIPKLYCEDYNSFCDLLSYVRENAEADNEFSDDIWNTVCNKYNTDKVDLDLRKLTCDFYLQVKNLKQRNILNIWINILKNAFIPLFHKKVDFIIGNPPWVNWQTLPEDYRNSIHKHWYTYKIFDFRGLKARLGNAHDDISVLLTYVVMDNFLNDKGLLAFVINQNLLQAYGGGEGFRKFKIKEETPIKVIRVDDYVDVEPFLSLGASNKTAVIFLRKAEETSYPVDYYKWFKLAKRGTIDAEDTLESVNSKIDYECQLAVPVNKNQVNSAWMIGSEQELDELYNMFGKSRYVGRKGVDTSANAIFWVEPQGKVRGKVRIRNTPENSKKVIPQVECFVEEKYLYPLVRGKDVKKWKYKCVYDIIIPYESNMKKVISKHTLKETSENLYKYFYDEKFNKYAPLFRKILVDRGTYKKHYSNVHVPEYVLYNIGEYTSAPYKVVWKALASKGMEACVLSQHHGKLIVPDHNNVMVPFDEELEAHYVCSILNSKIIGKFIDSYISWFKSSHILENINIPKYDCDNVLHRTLAELSLKAHQKALENNCDDLDIIEERIEIVVKKMFMGE